MHRQCGNALTSGRLFCNLGVSNPDESFGPQKSGEGIPFSMLMRDIMMFDESLDNARSRIASANRTVDLILGIGDGKLPSTGSDPAPFTGVQYR